MRRRLLLLASLSNLLLIAILATTVLPLVTSRATERLDEQLRAQILSVAAYLIAETPSHEQLSAFVATLDTQTGLQLGVLSNDGDVIGVGQFVEVNPRDSGRTYPATPLNLMSPRFFSDATGDRIASQGVSDGALAWIVEGRISTSLLQSAQRDIWLNIGVLALLALAVSITAAAVVSRRITQPLKTAVAGAQEIARGHLNPVRINRGPPEIVALGAALTTMSTELRTLILRERDRATTLSHSLRTPLTQVALELERLRRLDTQPARFNALGQSLHLVETSLTDVVAQSQVGYRGVNEITDFSVVLAQHLTFWNQLAKLQDRHATAALPTGAVWIEMDAKALGICVDALLNNIFRHTPSGTAYTVALYTDDRHATLTVSDSGPGLNTPASSDSSSKFGLTSTRRAVEAAGGSMTVNTSPGGTSVVIALDLTDPSPATISI